MPSSLNRLSHLHLSNPIAYAHSLRLQEAVLNRHWANREALRASDPTSASDQPRLHPPAPTLLTFQTLPTYTVGRRHLTDNPLSASQIAFLTGTDTASTCSKDKIIPTQAAEFYPSPRGGLLTYHAPGQLTAYPIIDLRRFRLSARNYIRLLEDVVINTCATFGVSNVGRSCGDPGVWVLDKQTGKVTDRKICAVGVRVTRGIGSHGIGLNVFDAPIPEGLRKKYNFQDPQGKALPAVSPDSAGQHSRGYLSWGFGRIVACGLEGKRTTWLSEEGADASVDVHEVAGVFAGELAKALNMQAKQDPKDMQHLDGVEQLTEEAILAESKDP